jgi:hypothetical protein
MYLNCSAREPFLSDTSEKPTRLLHFCANCSNGISTYVSILKSVAWTFERNPGFRWIINKCIGSLRLIEFGLSGKCCITEHFSKKSELNKGRLEWRPNLFAQESANSKQTDRQQCLSRGIDRGSRGPNYLNLRVELVSKFLWFPNGLRDSRFRHSFAARVNNRGITRYKSGAKRRRI